MKTYGLGRVITAPVSATDWTLINAESPASLDNVNGVTAWSDYVFSRERMAFRQIGGNSNGEKWERYYAAVEAPGNCYPSHTID